MTPTNLHHTITNPSITTTSDAPSPASFLPTTMRTTDRILTAAGYRAVEAVVRPAPVAVVGDITHYVFDLKTCTFTLSLRSARDTTPDGPSVFFLPELHFPRDGCTVETSGGRWEITSDEGEVQRLRWWHGRGEQSVKVVGVPRKLNAGDGGAGGEGEEAGYYDQVSNWIAQGCVVM